MSEIEKRASLLGSALTAHLSQNLLTNSLLKTRASGKYLANKFTEGLHGVVPTGLKHSVSDVTLSGLAPDLRSYGHALSQAGHTIRHAANRFSRKGQVAARLVTQGNFTKLKKLGLDGLPEVDTVHRELSRFIPNLPHPKSLSEEKAKRLEEVWHSKKYPLLSNVSSQITHGKLVPTTKYVEGKSSSKNGFVGSALAGLIEPATGMFDAAKHLGSMATDNKYLHKATSIVRKHLLEHPVVQGAMHGADSKLKDLGVRFGVNPVTSHLKRTSAAIAEALKD